MDAKNHEMEQQGQIKSTFEETLQAIDDRIKLFHSNHLSLETEIYKIDVTPKSISNIIGELGSYSFAQSPIQPVLRDLYTSQYQSIQQYRCVLPPPSQGEGSVNGDYQYEPSFDWLSRTIIDSTLLSLDQMKAEKTERGKVPTDWGNVNELLIYNISKKIHLKSEVKSIQKFIQNNFSKFPWVKIKRVRAIFYKAKPSVLLKFADQYSCFFAYVNFSKPDNYRKQTFGPNNQIYRIVQNRIKNIQQQKWVAVLFRRLPLSQTKESFLDLLRRNNLCPVWMQDLITIEKYKYTLCRVSYLDDAFEFCSCFQIKSPIKDLKINLHPKSCKAWKQDHQDYTL